MRFSQNLKKALLIGTVALLGCDVSLLFAAENNDPSQTNTSFSQEDAKLQKLQAQINALQKPAAPPDNTLAAQSSAGNNSASPLGSGDTPGAPGAVSNRAPDKLPPLENAQLGGLAPPSNNALSQVPAYQPQESGLQPPPGGGNGNLPQNASAGGQQPQASSSSSSAVKAISDKDINQAAFSSMVDNSFPMSPEQIQKLRSTYMASQFAAANVPNTPPRPTATSVFADLSPGATPPVVRLGQGFVTSLVFVDSTGSPWPIESYDVGNPSAFNIQWDKVSNTLMIQSTVLYTYGNLAIKLRGLNTPVMITLVPGQKAIDYRVDMRVPGYGPNAAPFTPNTVPAGSSPDLLNILDGVPPPNSTTLKVEGGNCQAWLAEQKMYVRTRLSVLSPGWSATLSSADGMHAYQMQPTPMLLVSQNGQVIQLKVQGF